MTILESDPAGAEVHNMSPPGHPSGVAPAAHPLHALHIGDEQRSLGPVTRPRTDRSKERDRSRLRPIAGVLATIAAAGAAWAGLRLALRPRAPQVQVATVLATSSAVGGAHRSAGGYVRHARIVNVVPRVSGVVASLRVAEGDMVKEGDLIATIDREQLEQQVAESRAELRATQARLAELQAGGRREEVASARARVEALRVSAERLERQRARSDALAKVEAVSNQAHEEAESDSFVAKKTLESAEQSLALLQAGPRPEAVAAAQAAVEGARARLARATDLLDHTEIFAPFSGRVLRKFVDVGASVSFGLPYTEGYNTLGPGSPIVSIGQLDGLEAIADINQTDLSRIAVGEQVEITADAFPGKTYPARLTRFSPRADRNKNTVEVTVRFDEPSPTELPHDMSVKLSFLGAEPVPSEARGLLIPASAILDRGGAKSVFVVEHEHVRPRQVVAGQPLPSGLVPVKEGLVGGETLVVANPEALKDGMAVAPVSTVRNEGESREP